MKEYTLNTNRREPRPRSRRLRELGGTASGGGGTTTILSATGSSGSSQTDPNSHWHENKASLDSISVDDGGYEWITTLKESGDSYEESREKVKAGYSDMAYDLDEDSPANNRFVSRLKDDVVKGNITFEQAVDILGKAIVRQTLQVLGDASVAGNMDVGGYEAGKRGARIGSMGDAELLSLVIRSLMRSPDFRAGFAGEGWRLALEDGLAKLEVDDLTVRRVMHIFELVIERIRSVGGQIIVSAANGKIKKVVWQETGSYRIYFEGDNQFRAHDLMRCQTFTGKDLHGYWVEVSYAYADSIVVDMSEFSGFAVPQEGDECVLMGNTTDPKRQNCILISATEDGQPRIDVLDGVSEKNLTGCLRARLGCLDGIIDSRFPADQQPHGHGLYADNAYLKGTFVLEDGDDVRTRFAVMEGKVSSTVEAIRNDSVPDSCYISNPTFQNGMAHWTTIDGEDAPYRAAGRWLWANGNILSVAGTHMARIVIDEGRRVLRLSNAYLIQRHADMDLSFPPYFPPGSTGKKQPETVYVAVMYRALKDGLLTIDFVNCNQTDFEPHATLQQVYSIKKGETYRQISSSGLWNATGDLRIRCSGEVLISRVVMSRDRASTLAYRYRTLFEQSDKVVRIAAENFDADGNVLQSSSIVTTAEANAMISEKFNADGSLKNKAGLVTTTEMDSALNNMNDTFGDYVKITAFSTLFAQAVSSNDNIVKRADISAFVTEDKVNGMISNIHLGADRINLEGLITANENFKVLENGSIEAKNGKFTGEVNATKGTFTNVTVTGLILHPAEMLVKDIYSTSGSGDASVITLPTYDQGGVIQYLSLGTSGFAKAGRMVWIYNPSSMPCHVCTYSDSLTHYGYTVHSNEVISLICVKWYDPTKKFETTRWICTARQEVTTYQTPIDWAH